MTMLGRSRQVLDVIVSHAQALGVFERVNTHEAKSSPGRGLYCSVWMDTIAPDPRTSGLAATSVRLVFLARLQSNALAEPQDGVDPNLLDALDLFVDAMMGDLSVGGHALDIDVFGMAGVPLGARAGYVDQDNKKFRVIDLQVPVLLDDVWVQVN
jgi:hypothetical protein